MELDQYQGKALRTAKYPRIGTNLIYPVLGLAGEAGECANKVKKLIRDYGYKEGLSFDVFYMNLPEKGKKIIRELQEELGDVLWYLALSAYETGTYLDKVGKNNNEKLRERYMGPKRSTDTS